MNITYYGQSCFLIEMNDTKLLFDPFISPNELAKDVDVDAIEADYILLTHGHQDHIADAERIGKKTGATIISNFEIVSWYEKKGLKGHSMNHGGKWKFDFGWVKYVNAIHSSTLPDGASGGNPGGFVIWDDDRCFYHAGDTALTYDMKLIAKLCPALDFAILPIGDNFTMGMEEAVVAADFINCKNIVGCHYDTFGYIEINHNRVKDYFASEGLNLRLMDINVKETI